jgi:hypothetical protein
MPDPRKPHEQERTDERVEDMELDASDSENVKGGFASTEIDPESTDDKHKGEIVIDSFRRR